MSLVIVGTVAFDAIETPFGKTDKIVGGSATYVGLSASKLGQKPKGQSSCSVKFSCKFEVQTRRGANGPKGTVRQPREPFRSVRRHQLTTRTTAASFPNAKSTSD